MANSTLQAIELKVRRLTRSPSTAQLSQADLDEYINTFLLYDFPEHLRMFKQRSQFTFICNPFQDVYHTDTLSFGTGTTNQLYNFQNKYITVHPPVYVSGYQSLYTQSPEQFYGIYPKIRSIANIRQKGDGVTTSFTGVINASQAIVPPGTTQQICLLKGLVLFDSIDVNRNGLSLVDKPLQDPVTGNPTVYGNLYDPTAVPPTPIYYPADLDATNTINYVTGAFTITFATAPATGATINSQTVPVQPAIPQAMLYYNNTFTLRPVPDQPYPINFEVYTRPTQLISESDIPELEEYWQYIAYGAARKIFQDRMDLESVNLIEPEYRKQQTLIQRRSIVQYTNERTATIYTEQTSNNQGSSWGWGGGNF